MDQGSDVQLILLWIAAGAATYYVTYRFTGNETHGFIAGGALGAFLVYKDYVKKQQKPLFSDVITAQPAPIPAAAAAHTPGCTIA